MKTAALQTGFPLLAALLLSSQASAAEVMQDTAESRCSALTSLRITGSTLEIQKAVRLVATSTTPTHCKVEGVLEPRTGSDGKPYAIGFAIALPESWNGRFLFQGGGGLNGTVSPPLGAAVAGDKSALARGFAVVSTDTGHQGAGFDASFLGEQQATMNFLYQAINKLTPLAKQVVVAHYRQPITKSYFVGCSTGGREAMLQSQRAPTEFDGIVAGAPAMRTNYSNLATRWISTSLNAVAPVGADGKPITAQALSPSDRKLVVEGLLQSCDALDGMRDGLIHNTRACKFDPAALACKGAKTDACLAPAQATALSKAFAGPVTTRGLQVYPGFPWDTGIAASGNAIPGLLSGGTNPEGPPASGTTMDVEAAAAVAHDGRSMAGDSNAWTNLGGFRAHGGKLIFYHGLSDPWFSANDTIDYVQRLARDNPQQPLSDWSRLFVVPGMGHCRGGDATLDQFDLLQAVVDWVEKDQAPQQVTATGKAFPGRSRPLCAYPAYAQYKGSGNSEDAANYSCRE